MPVANLPPRDRIWDLRVLILLLVSALLVYWPVLAIRPLRGDNLHVLAWVHNAPLSALLPVDPAIYPEWRPFAYFTIWIEYQLFQLSGVPLHFAVNVALWVACAWLVYRIVDTLTGARLAGAAAGAWLLFDRRAIESLSWIVERQTLLACLAGLTVILIVTHARHRRMTRPEAVTVAVLLSLAALSKEYGLSFAMAVVIYAIARRRPRLLTAGLVTMAGYVAARVVFAGGAVTPYCEDMGFFHSVDVRCIDPLAPAASALQMAYNAGATVVGTLVPGLLGEEGALGIDRPRVVRALVVLGIAGLGWRAGGPVARLLLLVPLLNGALSFMLYRDRNQLIGAAAVAIAAGLGMALGAPAANPRLNLALRRAALGLVALVIAIRIADAHIGVRAVRDDLSIGREPCESSIRERPFGDEYVRLVKLHYGMEDPDCRRRDGLP